MRGALLAAGGFAVGAGAMYLATRRLGSLLGVSNDALKEAAAVHVRQIRRYAFASSQDKSPIVGITHASYALVLLDTLEELVGRDAIRAAGYDPARIRAFITANQDRHAETLRSCDPYLLEVLAMERNDPNGQLPGFVFADAVSAPRGA